MARLPRVSPVNVAQHVIQRGNNRQVCFANEDDMKAYVTWLKDYSKKYEVEIHAWVLMSNHVHLLCTPRLENGVSRMMQSLGRMYVHYFNRTYNRTGGLWEGRYRSCVVESESYLIHVYRYIELNPVRAGMVDDPADYSWSSYQCNGLGKESGLRTPHSVYLEISSDKANRLEVYRDLFKAHVEGELLKGIRDSVNKGLALGDERFTRQIETLTGMRASPGKMGRPVLKKKSA